jgi:hypothetical protein
VITIESDPERGLTLNRIGHGRDGHLVCRLDGRVDHAAAQVPFLQHFTDVSPQVPHRARIGRYLELGRVLIHDLNASGTGRGAGRCRLVDRLARFAAAHLARFEHGSRER